MRFRLALALSLSILLVGAASWYRFTAAKKTQPNIVAVESLGIDDQSYEDLLRDFLGPGAATATSSEGLLSKTDLVGRELIMDYIGLAASGGATQANIAALADRYVESIPTLNRTEVINYSDIKVVTNTKSNFQNYADAITKIYNEHVERIGEANTETDSLDALSPTLYSFTSNFSTTYREAALKLKGLSVPASLAPTHVQLVNSYLSSAVAMEAISNTEDDSASAFAGLVTLNENLNEEEALLNEISQILTSNGI